MVVYIYKNIYVSARSFRSSFFFFLIPFLTCLLLWSLSKNVRHTVEKSPKLFAGVVFEMERKKRRRKKKDRRKRNVDSNIDGVWEGDCRKKSEIKIKRRMKNTSGETEKENEKLKKKKNISSNDSASDKIKKTVVYTMCTYCRMWNAKYIRECMYFGYIYIRAVSSLGINAIISAVAAATTILRLLYW